MKRFLTAMGAMLLLLPLAAVAQNDFTYNHAELGVFGDFFRANLSDTNLVGVGGRVGFSVHPNIKLELGGAYDFEHNITNNITGINCQGNPDPNCGFVRNGLRATHFSFGPKFQLGTHGPIRAFVFAKGGFVRFGSSFIAVTPGNFPTGLKGRDVNGTFYPGGGIEAFAGWFGVRADIGDEIYFDRGAHNNLRITFGPVIRF